MTIRLVLSTADDNAMARAVASKLSGKDITADALHTRHDHARCLHERGAHNLVVVTRNRPGLHGNVRHLP